MSDESPTKKQHYVPRFYLKNFADDRGFLQVLDLKNRRIGSPRPYQGVGYAHYFYAEKTGVPDEISQHIEKWLQRIESSIASELPEIIRRILNCDQITIDDRYILSVLMSMIWLRTPRMREYINRMNEDITKQSMRFYIPESIDRFVAETRTVLSEAEREKMIETLDSGSYRLHYNNAQHLRLMTESLGIDGPGFTNVFFNMKWKIYLARGTERFITTDSPLVEWWLPPQGFYGASILQREKYFPLTPEILIQLTYPERQGKPKRKTIFSDQDDVVKFFNMQLVGNASEFAYTGDRRIIENLLARRIRPEKFEQEYYKKYVRPWDEYHERKRAYRSKKGY